MKNTLTALVIAAALATLTGCPPRMSHAKIVDGRYHVAVIEAAP